VAGWIASRQGLPSASVASLPGLDRSRTVGIRVFTGDRITSASGRHLLGKSRAAHCYARRQDSERRGGHPPFFAPWSSWRGPLTPQLHVTFVRRSRAVSVTLPSAPRGSTLVRVTFSFAISASDRFCPELAFI
jgi:hypothetical protein